jgi:uncharacterized protein YndB with AHSA1/START domain
MPVHHGTFTIDRRFAAPVHRVFAAWCDPDTKARWFIGPPERWTLRARELDLRVGGREVLRGQLVGGGGRETLFEARYHDVQPDQRLVYAYDMFHAGQHLSVSLATVEFEQLDAGGTRMKFTEQATFFEEDGLESRRLGTDAHFDRLAPVLADAQEIVSSRTFAAPRERVFRAFAEAGTLERWWGPKGFRNTFSQFDFRPGGAWIFTMHAPDGADHPNRKDFLDIVPPSRIVFRHAQAGHEWVMTMTFTDLGERCHVVWRMRFATVEQAEEVRAIVVEKNEENLDRLAAVL